MLAARTTLPHFSVSSAMSFSKSAGEPGSTAAPRSARLENDVPNQPSSDQLEADPLLHRFTVVFDREGYSPNFFVNEAALAKLEIGFTDVILKNLNEPPTCASPQMREKVALIQRAFRDNPKAADAVKERVKADPKLKIFDIEDWRTRSKDLIEEINQYVQGCRVLCVTTHRDSEKMWTDYAQNHEGIALRIEPNVEKDSKFQRFFPVQYRASRPSLYNETLAFIEGGLFGDQVAAKGAMLDTIIYSKTLEWEHESEYRLVIPLRRGEKTMPYHPEEITELYLGLTMTKKNKDEIIGMARVVNPNIAIFQTSRGVNQTLTFQKL
jgi:hypothetical protein